MSIAHAVHYRHGNFVKLAYLGRFYLTEAESNNPLGIAAAARAIFEAHVSHRFIEGRLAEIVKRPTSDWRKRGEAFFAQVLRARFATKDLMKSTFLARAGLPKGSTTPYTVSDCITDTKRRFPDTFPWLAEHYAVLCDYVHVNLSSQTVGTVEMLVTKEIRHPSGGALIFREDTPVVRYTFPSKTHGDLLLELTLERARQQFQDALRAINATPETPFRETELRELTGNEYGVEMLKKPGAMS
jgi:hypothetical protein